LIRKYLIIGKQIALSSTRHEVSREDGVPHPMEVKIPVEILWQAQDIIKSAEFQQASGEDAQTVKNTYKTLIKLLAPHCTSEKDRQWLYEQIT